MILHWKKHAVTDYASVVIIWFLLIWMPCVSYSEDAPLKFFGTKPLKRDTIPYYDILSKFDWNIKIISENTLLKQFTNCKADTAFNHIDKFDTAVLFTSFIVDTHLVNQYYPLSFSVTGSAKVIINQKVVLETGDFCKDKKSDFNELRENDFTGFTIIDTLVNIEVIYVPHPEKKGFDLDLYIGSLEWEKNEKKMGKITINESFALGFFYLAFAIIFMILFLFFKVRKENLYFSMFCLLASVSFLCITTYPSITAHNLFRCSLIIAIEFLSIFFAKILLNHEKTKVPLLFILMIACISFYPSILYIRNDMESFTFWIKLTIFLLLIIYASISSLYFLLQGFGQKKWEAKVITYGFLIGFFFSTLSPIIIRLIYQNNEVVEKLFTQSNFLGYMSDFGLCIYPLTVAIVLGRRNGKNQKQLIQQVLDIEKLSLENLEKEKEKKQILENQKSELEIKVVERTQEVWQQKEVIEIKNKEITDSLIYAKRIQSAILPDIKLIYKTLEQSFILYLPKDIVSGDFYGFAQKNDKVLIAAADCTGHGVAGAFMSMIGSSLLNQIVNEKSITEPALILEELNEGIIHSLKQKESESNDGMDISICAFDFKSNSMQFAGANRPLWLIRNNELLVFKPNKLPIGGLQILHDEKFKQHEIDLKPDDSIYIFSDGFADQFGGEKGKKLMSKKFKELLLSIQNLSMREQEHHLRDHFEKWKGNNEQVDDVLVIGIRI